jgi:4-hydroxybenzoate polyprenyltransferase/phosphoserine phosphatase
VEYSRSACATPFVSQSAAQVPLVVDLDGTLCRSDTLHEAIAGLAMRKPTALLTAPAHLLHGKVALKRHVADHQIVPPETLPYDQAVLDLVADARSDGRMTVLASASDHRQVEAVAKHLGLFDQFVGTGSPTVGSDNLGGKGKARHLAQEFGARGFDYVGDSATDLPVWAAARTAYVVRPSAALHRHAAAAGVALTELGARKGSALRVLVEAFRPHQWAKNLLVLLPVLAAHQLDALGPALLGIVCFSLAASGVYIINDLVDLTADRAHPRKRHRPFASGRLAISTGIAAAVGLFASSLVISLLLLPTAFTEVLLFYVVATFVYSLWLKRKMMVDVIGLAGLYTIRIVAGGAATGIVLSPWLLVFSMFMFFSLAIIKRQTELEEVERMGGERTAGRNLHVLDLPILQSMAVTSGQAAVLVVALYVQDDIVQQNYAWPGFLLLICPVLFFWLSRIQILTRRGHMTDDPLVFTMRDRVSLMSGVVMVAIAILAKTGI